MHCRYLLIVIGALAAFKKPTRIKARDYINPLRNDTGNWIAPVGEAGRIGEGTDLNGVSRSRAEAGDRRGWLSISVVKPLRLGLS